MTRPAIPKLVQSLFLALAVAAALGLIAYVVAANWSGGDPPPVAAPRASLSLDKIPFDGAQAYRYLQEICKLGPRVSGSKGMQKQQEMLEAHFKALGGEVKRQEFVYPSPVTGEETRLANLIVSWHPERTKRILLCTHYDTRPYPDQERDYRRRRDVFLGANDGGSGTALLMELGRHMPKLASEYGVDFVFFDAEEWIYTRSDKYFVGSEYFARQYRDHPEPFEYKHAVLLDMIGDRDLQIYYESNSERYARPLMTRIFDQARELGVTEFVPSRRHEVLDDHIKLNDIAGIPTVDLIDFDYPNPRAGNVFWHTTRDTPENCSALSLAKVGWVLLEWLKSET